MTGNISALLNSAKGYVVGLIAGAVVQEVVGVTHLALVFAIGLALVYAIDGYLRGSTRSRQGRSAIEKNAEVSVYRADKHHVFGFRHR
ncbi:MULTISPECIES: hypothetical protein [unclassified Methylobacterium]|uniref:hypothetical protein n=1 Tax=unclassified Methylobacterium TaxID=2615210 RepID=UPI002269A515|nr:MULTISPECIES: hypothetical protein [unclassified Methylobacterium]